MSLKDFDHLKIEMKDILLATNNFDQAKLIGRGGFGNVYKGELSTPEGRIMVAFKQLDRRLGQGNTEFWKEVMLLSKYKHENLISLVHFCIDGDQMILVYEYASRGSLDKYLNDPLTLTWIQRLKISVEVARGLEFLHDPKTTQQRVLHRDIKSGNILLDGEWKAKVSDFGLSKVGPANQQHTYLISNASGTPGYCDPMYVKTGLLSKESDVYSFGVVLFEILCGRLCCEYDGGKLIKILVCEWEKCYEDDRLDEIIPVDLRSQMSPGSWESFSAIAYECLRGDREDRPTMAKIRSELELLLKKQVAFEKPKEIKRKKIMTPQTSESRVWEPRAKNEFQHKKNTSSGSYSRSTHSSRQMEYRTRSAINMKDIALQEANIALQKANKLQQMVHGFQSMVNIESEDDSIESEDEANDSDIVRMRGGTLNPIAFGNMRMGSLQYPPDGRGRYEFAIEGDAKPGNTLTVVTFGSFQDKCVFQWVRSFEDDTFTPIEEAVEAEYVVTADDVGSVIAVDYAVVFRNGKQGKTQRMFANQEEEVTCDPVMQQEIGHYMSAGVASFSALVCLDLDTRVPARIFLTRSRYQIDIEDCPKYIKEEYGSDLWIEIPPGFNMDMVLTSPNHRNCTFNFRDLRTRDVCVLTMRQFQSDYLDQFPGPLLIDLNGNCNCKYQYMRGALYK